VKTLPQIREAIEQRNWKEAEQGVVEVSKAISSDTEKVQQATGILVKKPF